MTFENIYFGYTGDGLTTTEYYPGVPPWWSLPLLPDKVRAEDMDVESRGFAVPWAMYVDEEHRFWLNGNYSVYPEPSEKACMEVASPHGWWLLRRDIRLFVADLVARGRVLRGIRAPHVLNLRPT